jgi:phosphomannomutase
VVAGPLEPQVDWLAQARSWLADDPDATTAAQLSDAIDAALSGDASAQRELRTQFSGRLEFGTAGLRGPMGWGPRRMNRVSVGRAAAGFGAWLRANGGGPVVIGFDARHNSATFAQDTAQILAGLDITVLLLPGPLPTPVLAFAIADLGARAGVMVTASHNPAPDNGYKVYVGRSQISPPVDAQIATAIDAVGSLRDVSRSDRWTLADGGVVARYAERAAGLVAPTSARDVHVVYTAVHGVAGELVRSVLVAAGFPAPQVVAQQFDPDPDFPSVSSPNPEDPQTLRLALAVARGEGADLVVATDPDGDRCAVAVPDPQMVGGWRVLSGNEVGDLLGAFLVDDPRPGAFATTVVSGHRLGAIARAHGRPFAQTLTGFKWLSTVPTLRYAFEEAIGYCVDPDAVLDKDGITAALRVVELAATVKAQGRSLLDALLDLDLRYGIDLTERVVVDVAADQIEVTQRLRRLTRTAPDELAGLAVAQVDDLALGVDDLPGTPGVRITLDAPWPGGLAQVVVRPSGTEPKLKAYLEVALPPAGAQESLREQQHTAAAVLAGLSVEVSRLLR